MQVKLKFSVEQVFSINKLLNEVYKISFNTFTTEEKVQISIGATLSDMFEKRKRKLYKELDLLNSTKKISLTFKYHEAWALKEILLNKINLLDSDFHRLNAQTSINLLDQKVR